MNNIGVDCIWQRQSAQETPKSYKITSSDKTTYCKCILSLLLSLIPCGYGKLIYIAHACGLKPADVNNAIAPSEKRRVRLTQVLPWS
jgi:hypothetical protein